MHILEKESLDRTLLREMPEPPRRLWVRGDLSILARRAIAIVGTRRPSAYGLRGAMLFARALGAAGAVIVSGLARGIDAIAHRGALDVGAPTVAVLGHGFDYLYPREHTALAARILENGGALVSEYPPETPPMKHHFPQRNRIIAGLAMGTLVVEAAESSGSLITARMALDANREVFVLPGRFDESGFSGSHRLIQQGARLVVDPSDIIAETATLAVAAGPDAGLAKLFAAHEGAASLEALCASSGWDLPELVQRVEAARESGCVVEIDGQTFLWARNRLPK